MKLGIKIFDLIREIILVSYTVEQHVQAQKMQKGEQHSAAFLGASVSAEALSPLAPKQKDERRIPHEHRDDPVQLS